ncbi:MAG: hypothetical protein AABZ53_12785 [Planctomycetota bacterium]
MDEDGQLLADEIDNLEADRVRWRNARQGSAVWALVGLLIGLTACVVLMELRYDALARFCGNAGVACLPAGVVGSAIFTIRERRAVRQLVEMDDRVDCGSMEFFPFRQGLRLGNQIVLEASDRRLRVSAFRDLKAARAQRLWRLGLSLATVGLGLLMLLATSRLSPGFCGFVITMGGLSALIAFRPVTAFWEAARETQAIRIVRLRWIFLTSEVWVPVDESIRIDSDGSSVWVWINARRYKLLRMGKRDQPSGIGGGAAAFFAWTFRIHGAERVHATVTRWQILRLGAALSRVLVTPSEIAFVRGWGT